MRTPLSSFSDTKCVLLRVFTLVRVYGFTSITTPLRATCLRPKLPPFYHCAKCYFSGKNGNFPKQKRQSIAKLKSKKSIMRYPIEFSRTFISLMVKNEPIEGRAEGVPN